jgi:hypothetical protein
MIIATILQGVIIKDGAILLLGLAIGYGASNVQFQFSSGAQITPEDRVLFEALKASVDGNTDLIQKLQAELGQNNSCATKHTEAIQTLNKAVIELAVQLDKAVNLTGEVKQEMKDAINRINETAQPMVSDGCLVGQKSLSETLFSE